MLDFRWWDGAGNGDGLWDCLLDVIHPEFAASSFPLRGELPCYWPDKTPLMKASQTELQDEYLTENPYEFRTSQGDPPWFTISSFLAVPALTVASLPFVKEACRLRDVRDDLPNVGEFDGLAVLMGLFVMAGAASLLGLILGYVAERKDEPWKGLRIAAWVINGFVSIRFFFWLLAVALFAVLFGVGRS